MYTEKKSKIKYNFVKSNIFFPFFEIKLIGKLVLKQGIVTYKMPTMNKIDSVHNAL